MKTLAHNIHTPLGRRKLFMVIVGGIVVSFLLYGFAITTTTLAIAEANSDNNEIQSLQTDIAELEVEYFEIINTLSLEEAQKIGFTELSNMHYARADETKAVAYNF